MAAVWHRFAWLAHPELHKQALQVMQRNARMAQEAQRAQQAQREGGVRLLVQQVQQAQWEGGVQQAQQGEREGPQYGQAALRWLRPLEKGEWEDDAFNTVMQWLYHKMGSRQQQQQQAGGQEGGPEGAPGGRGG